MTIRSILVANRGEIAVRIIKAAKALGIRTVQVHSAADADMLAVKLADQAVDIGSPAPKKSYLNIEAVVNAAKAASVDAVHPGYGFLSENADFADAVEAAGLIFIGPKGDAIRLLGDKVAAREVAARAGVPTVPGSAGRLATLEEARAVAEKTGFPIMIKAAAGGGGRGIRIAADLADLERHFPQASAEALASFGDGGLYLEKVITKARHVEVQILGDGENFVTASSGRARCNAAARRSGRRRRPSCFPPRCASGCATVRWRWRGRSAIAARARWSISMTRRRVTSISSR